MRGFGLIIPLGVVQSYVKPVLLSLFAMYVYLFPWSLLVVIFDLMPTWGASMGGVMLIVQGTMLAIWLAANYAWRGALAALLIFVLSWGVEHLGVTTSFPFGSYSYSDVLGLKLFGVVPLAVPFAWVLVIPAAIGVTEWLFHREGNTASNSAHVVMKVLGVASLALLMDVAIEPVAADIHGYWVWQPVESAFYGVPAENFVAWWVLGAIFAAIFYALVPRTVTPDFLPTRWQGGFWRRASLTRPLCTWLPATMYMSTLLLLSVTNLVHGKIGAAAIGALVLGFLLMVWAEPRVVGWIIGKPQTGAGIGHGRSEAES